MAEALDEVLKQVVASLNEALGDNLYSCCLYGSAVRGNFVDGTSDINLLILLNQSDVHAHMRPLLLHASSEASDPAHRRVIHLEYATGPLAGGLDWAEALS